MVSTIFKISLNLTSLQQRISNKPEQKLPVTLFKNRTQKQLSKKTFLIT